MVPLINTCDSQAWPLYKIYKVQDIQFEITKHIITQLQLSYTMLYAEQYTISY